MKSVKIALIGNPNCGKTTLFNLLTGSHQHVGNWPGVTVEKKDGTIIQNNYKINLIDLPGIYSFSPNSIEERIARNYIINEQPDLILNIIDGTALERSLFLTTQIIDTNRPFIFVVNMYDEVKKKGINIDLKQISLLLKVPVIGITAKKEEGIDSLLIEIEKQLNDNKTDNIIVNFGEDIEKILADIECRIQCNEDLVKLYNPRWLSINLLQDDKEIIESINKKGHYLDLKPLINDYRKELNKIYQDDIEIIISEKRYGFIHGIIKECTHLEKATHAKFDYTELIDTILLNKFISFPLFALILWVTFQLTFFVGGFFSNYINKGVLVLGILINNIMPNGILKALVLDGVISGVGGILVFFPQIMILFFIIALLEDSGYMARVAFIMDRLMHFLGLHGKSFISLFMGIGCNVPGIMAARTLENEDDRKVTVLINPFMSCSARFPIYILIAGIFFGKFAGSIIFFLYFLGVIIAIVTAKLLKIFFFRKTSMPFVMELPPYRTPTMKSILIHMWERASLFFRKMGGVILVGSIIIWVLGYFPRTTIFSEKVINLEKQSIDAVDSNEKNKLLIEIEYYKSSEQMENSFIGRIGKVLEPAFKPLGFGWKETVALITGIAGKEIVVSTIAVLYGTGKENNSVLKQKMTAEGMTPAAALGFLVFVLLYVPCLATIGAIFKETNSIKWGIFSIVYGIGIAYLISLIINQIGKMIFNI